MVLKKKFFDQPTLEVAQNLLGKYLVRRVAPTRGRSGSRLVAAIITEVEAYDGPRDKASHASRGLTKRNAPMFGPPGYWYVYFTYGMHWMLNIVTGREGCPAAVLIRGVKLEGAVTRHSAEIIDGPAKITKLFRIGKGFNNKKAGRRTGLWIEDRGIHVPRSHIKRSPRIGVNYAGSVWTRKKYRFVLHSKT
ncbi:MAG: DNA-3-methyladenine glycosylase [Candidatus Jorgensenbacteria bacterium]|nr:DNA-3-methyladenine glycosylase [Candidatus Jorgensenbacteria bacterium]